MNSMNKLERLKYRKMYDHQKYHAKKRNIEWQLTFEEWLNWWIDSGHLQERGNVAGKYCMGRKGDVGPYALNNIECVLFERNAADGSRRKRPNRAASISREKNHKAKKVKINGKVYDCLKTAADHLGINYDNCRSRIYRKWPGYEYI